MVCIVSAGPELASSEVSGTALPSHTILNGRFVIRVAITNHRSDYGDFDLLVETVARLGAASEMLLTRDKAFRQI